MTERVEQDRPTSLWRLAKAGGSSGSGSSSDCNSSAGSSSGSEDSDGVYVIINGKRAQSKRTGKVFGQIAGLKRNSDVFEVRTSDGASLNMPVSDLDTDSLGQEFGASVDVDNLENSIRPLLHSTPYPRKDSHHQQRKRQKSATNTHRPDQKYKGCVQVPLSMIRKAPPGYTLIGGNAAKVESFKVELRSNPHHHIPVLPVMVHEQYSEDNADDTEHFLLGGYSLWEAIVDLVDDERFAHYQRCMVKVYAGLTEVEALEVGAAFQQHQTLLRDEIPDLEAKVKMCRRLLYRMHNIDEDVDEPPSTVKDDWRKQAAAALGCMTSSVDGRKPLEPTFQLALYSRRCYAKLVRLFAIHRDKTGKPLKISIFLQLQGMAETERFNLLSRLVVGELQLKEVKGEALKIKRLSMLRRTMRTLTRSKTWDECVQRYPIHTQDSALEQFLGKDMRKSVPQEFVDFIREAEETIEGHCTSMEQLKTSPVTLTVIEVQSTKRMKGQVKKIKEGTSQLAILSDQLEVAAAWQAEMKRHGFNNMTEAVVIKDANAQHLVVGGEQQSNTLPKVLYDSTCYHTLLETYTKPQDQVVCCVHNPASFEDEARSMDRVSRKLWWFSGDATSHDESHPTSSSDDYEFVE